MSEDRSLPALSVLINRHHLPMLDGIRAVAVMMVIASHAGGSGRGGLGVTIFFVLSGFLITWLLIKEREQAGTVSLRNFYARRALRIFPAYYAFLAFSIAVDITRGDERIFPVILPGAFYYINYWNAVHGHSSASIAHAWSLAIEEQFYLLWPIAFLFLAARGPQRLVKGLAAAVVAVMVWRSYVYLVLDWGASYAYNAFDCRFDSLATGCLLAVLVRNRQFGALMQRLAHSSVPMLCAMFGMLWMSSAADGTLRYSFGFTVISVLVAFTLVQLLLLSERWPWRWLEWAPVRFVGRISYGMYLYHQWGAALARKVVDGPWIVDLVAATFGTLLFATLSYYLIEQPFLRAKQRIGVDRAGGPCESRGNR